MHKKAGGSGATDHSSMFSFSGTRPRNGSLLTGPYTCPSSKLLDSARLLPRADSTGRGLTRARSGIRETCRNRRSLMHKPKRWSETCFSSLGTPGGSQSITGRSITTSSASSIRTQRRVNTEVQIASYHYSYRLTR
jgi:hypothetical protein